MRRRAQILVLSLFVASFFYVDAMGQKRRTYPPFTSVSRLTEYDAKGEVVQVSTHVRYESSTGDWRVVSKVGGDEHATVYRRGQGVYQSNSRTLRLIKLSNHAPGCPLRTGAELRNDPKFSRTEEVLGLTAYVLIENHPARDVQIEHYYVPELGGGTPFKQVTTYKNGPKFVNEPISFTMGEPAAIDITGPNYLVIEQEPVFLQNIGEHLLLKPDPHYPAEALTQGLSGTVRVTVTVDETGRVIMAASLRGAPQSLRDAAVEAAYIASFKAVIAGGVPVVAKGIIEYRFVPPKWVASGRLQL
jgi:TonB family protein